MAGKPVVLVGPVKIGKGKTVDPSLAKGADKSLLACALKAFKSHDAVKATRSKEGYQFEPVLTALHDDGGTLKCAIESTSHPLGKLKPMAKAATGGAIPTGGPRDVPALLDAVMAGHVKKVEGNLKRLK
ncbi:MAG: hypothetical protein AAF138_01610 [Planctomycetota bacterium]